LRNLEVESYLAPDHGVHLARSEWRRLNTLRGQLLLNLRWRERQGGFRIKLVDDRARCLRRDKHAIPVVEVRILVTRLKRGRQVRQCGRALGRANRKRHQLLVLDERQTGRDTDENEIDSAGHDLGEGLRTAAERHVCGFEAGTNNEALRGPMRGAANAS